MYIPTTLFVSKLSANSFMGLKVCKLLGTRQKKIKITISTLFFQKWYQKYRSPIRDFCGEAAIGGEAANPA